VSRIANRKASGRNRSTSRELNAAVRLIGFVVSLTTVFVESSARTIDLTALTRDAPWSAKVTLPLVVSESLCFVIGQPFRRGKRDPGSMLGPAVLHGERVTLRTIERDDAEFLQRGHNDPEIRVPLGNDQPENENQAEESVEENVESEKGVSLLVCLGEEPIGRVSAKGVRRDRTELVYWFVPDCQGKGYGSESVALFADYLMESFPVHRLHIRPFDFNEGSRGVARNLGFTEEGRFREARFVRGEYVDVYHYGLLRPEWAERRPLAER
jgi:RimJ/RimL family protein N-acetyltransferase